MSEIKQLPLADDNLEIIFEFGYPRYIRDRGGMLFEFKRISRFTGQDQRYNEECAQQKRLAEFLLAALELGKGLEIEQS